MIRGCDRLLPIYQVSDLDSLKLIYSLYPLSFSVPNGPVVVRVNIMIRMLSKIDVVNMVSYTHIFLLFMCYRTETVRHKLVSRERRTHNNKPCIVHGVVEIISSLDTNMY